MTVQYEAKRLATIKQLPSIYPAFTQSSLRWHIFNAKSNGFSKCVQRIGRRVLIDLNSFEQWIDEHGPEINKGGAK